MAGYSLTPLSQKLGLKPGMRTYLMDAPQHYFSLFEVFPENVRIDPELEQFVHYDFIHAFFKDLSELQKQFPVLKNALAKTGLLWISWPKRASSIQTDIVEGNVMNIGLAAGLVDVKVAAIDDDWSGLKFVWRVRDR